MHLPYWITKIKLTSRRRKDASSKRLPIYESCTNENLLKHELIVSFTDSSVSVIFFYFCVHSIDFACESRILSCRLDWNALVQRPYKYISHKAIIYVDLIESWLEYENYIHKFLRQCLLICCCCCCKNRIEKRSPFFLLTRGLSSVNLFSCMNLHEFVCMRCYITNFKNRLKISLFIYV